MVLEFSKICYDMKNDVPIVIFGNDANKTFYFKVSYKTAEDILNIINDDHSGLLNLFFQDIFLVSNAKLITLSLDSYISDKSEYEGALSVIINDVLKKYTLSCDEVILLSVLFKKKILINPEMFIDIVESSQKANFPFASPAEEDFLNKCTGYGTFDPIPN